MQHLILMSLTVLGLLAAGFLSSCGRSELDTTNLSNVSDVYQDFCSLSGISPSAKAPQLWSSESVQHYINQLTKNTKIANTPWAAYPIVYKKMTAARDEARCHGVLHSNKELDARINDLLSDLMTRFYVLQVEACATGIGLPEVQTGFCGLMAKMRRDKFDTLSAAMASTGVYISSHISLALSAIILADEFWNASSHPETFSGARNQKQTLSARISYLRAYKPLYDRFNQFLADNIITVVHALKDANMLHGEFMPFLAGITRFMPFRALPFGKIRDEAFDLAIELATTLDPKQHPMLRLSGNIYQIDYGTIKRTFKYPTKLLKLEERGIDFTANETNITIYRRVLGGVSWEEATQSKKL